jgi:outer membrane protein assembly factor BamB
VGTIPKSHLSAVGEGVYLFERPEGQSLSTLVARDLEKGTLRWSYQAESSEATAPVVVHGKILFRDRSGAVVAVRRSDGTLAWKAALSLPEATDVAWSTSMAAALGSATLLAVVG